jgi:rhamnosyltransferase
MGFTHGRLMTPTFDITKKQSLPNIAVCLAAFNGVLWLPEQLDSILNQKGVLITVIVSVDSSTDGTENLINQYALEDDRIVVLPHGKRFGGAARNFYRILQEVDFSGFDYVSFADQDDVWFSKKLVIAHEKLMHTGADAYSSDIVAFWPSGRKILIKKSYLQRRWDYLFEAAGPGCTYVIKVNLVRAFQSLLLERWREVRDVEHHDWLMYAFARANAYRWIIHDRVGMLYRQHGENQVGVNAGWQAFICRVRIVLNGEGIKQAALIAVLTEENDSFVKRWLAGRRIGYLWLVLNAAQCRRRIWDRVLFAISCMVLFIVARPR